MISRSKQRNTFQMESHQKKLEEDPTNENALHMIAWYRTWNDSIMETENNPEWAIDNMEHDLRTTDWILEKARESRVYAQHLYAAMCNRDFMKNEVWPILQEKRWSCSWRHAGGIIADMREEGDYIDWYCSGIGDRADDIDPVEFNNLSAENQIRYKESLGFVSEAVVTDEIKEDLMKLGWIVLDED